MKWKKLSTKLIYKNEWMTFWEDKVIRPDGKKGIYSYVETNGPSVYIIALTEKGEFYIIKQFRYTTKMDSWEIPAGNSDGENLLKAAKRELQEETGFIAKEWREIGIFQLENGFATETGHIFMAKILTESNRNSMSEEGISKIKKVTFGEVFKMINNGVMTDSNSISSIVKAALFLDKI